jgi:uncharacterized protein (TIGR00251 family)
MAQATAAAIIRSLVAKRALTIEVRLTPRASRNEISGFRDGVLICRVTAPPVDDRANVALCRLIAKRLGVAPSRVRIERGARGRDKLLSVEGAPPDARTRLGG